MRRIAGRIPIGGVVCLLAVTAVAGTSRAFWSDGPNVHAEITDAALQGVFTDKDGKKTRQTIIEKNTAQDFFSGERDLKKAHFDSETFEDSIKLIATRLNDTLTALSIADKERALKDIGQILHALQDFYSHSNWVENHLPAVNPLPANIPIFAALVSKNNQGEFSAGPLKANEKFTAPTLVCDFNAQKPPKAFGNDLKKITTGYFPDEDTEEGKCSHAQHNKDAPIASRTVLWKTYTSARGAAQVNGATMNVFARDPATRHTTQLIADLLQAIDDGYGVGDGNSGPNMRELLTKDEPVLTCAIDTSATMGEEITGLQAAVAGKVGEFIAAGAVPRLRLISFTDSVTDHGAVNGLEDLNAFTALVNGLSTSGGGDCPEASLSAIERSLATTPAGGAVITVTDASPREGSAVAARLTDVAREKGIALHFLVTGDCGDGGAATYRQMAADTGGNLFWADGASSGSVEATAAELIDDADPNLVSVLLVQQPIAAGASRSWTVPVDAELTRVDFVLNRLSGGNVGLQVLDPSATPVSVTDLGMVQVARVTNPTPGQWTMTVSGDVVQASEYAASVQGLSGLALVGFSHFEPIAVEPGAHPLVSFFNGSPLRSSPVDVLAVVTGTAQAEVFELSDFADCAVEPPPVLPGCSSAGLGLTEESDGAFGGAYSPTQPGPLLARVRGTDGVGHPMQRVLRRPFRSSTLRVRPPLNPPSALPGSSVSAQFEITNGGLADTFAIEAVSASGFTASVSTPTLALAAGGTSQIPVMVTVPLGTPPGEDPLLLRTTSISDPTITNMGTTTVRVPAGELSLSAATLSVSEADGAAVITVNRTGGAAGTVTVDYATSDIGAESGVDYTATSGTLTFAPGELSQTFNVPIANDSVAESSETLRVELSNFRGGALPGDVLVARLTILDDDPCVAGWGPFPGDDPGIVPINAAASTCEQKVAKNAAKLSKKLLKCHTKQVGAQAKGKTFDEEGCEAAARSGFLSKSNTSLCPCVDTTTIAAAAASVLDANNVLIYCDPAGPAIGGDETGTVPSTSAIQKCEDKIAKQAAKLVKAWVNCHVAYATCKQPMDEAACEAQAITAFLGKVTGLEGCDSCEDIPDLIDVIETQLDEGNHAVFCE